MQSQFQEYLKVTTQRIPTMKGLSLYDSRGGEIASGVPAAQSVMHTIYAHGEICAQGISNLNQLCAIGSEGAWMGHRFSVDGEGYSLWAWWRDAPPAEIMRQVLVDLERELRPLLLIR